MTKGYCMKCKKEVDMKDVVLGTNARGAPVAKGTCEACGTNLYRILKKDSADGKSALKAGPLPGGKSRRSRKSGGSRHSRKSGGSRHSRKSRSRRSRK